MEYEEMVKSVLTVLAEYPEYRSTGPVLGSSALVPAWSRRLSEQDCHSIPVPCQNLVNFFLTCPKGPVFPLCNLPFTVPVSLVLHPLLVELLLEEIRPYQPEP